MNTSILLVGHGSRHPAGNDEIKQFSTQWKKMNPHWRIETCFIEFADVLLDEGLDTAARHAKRVIVVPLILNAAGHVKMEIPHHINEARRRHTSVEFVYAPHLGANDSIFTLLQRNLRKVMAQLDMPDPKTTGVILLGRGSSDRIANGEVAKMARWLFDENDHTHVDIAFTGITYPRLEAVIRQQVALGMTQIAILPYYLFTGTLIERIKRQVKRLQQQYPQIALGHGSYFGFEPEIYALLNQRVDEARGETPATRMMECDGCHYRQLAEDHGHGHNHDHSHDHPHHENKSGVAA
ncbi:MAG: sirohydrochlorin chelatase [Gammaproteobacteria bacterium]|nr:sirohydrochlorin chelatase [Gammaproteobacteria bacterium]MCF6364351.1 sirohydrochlorin chelatase [Gammaproteobacteria bacterium]